MQNKTHDDEYIDIIGDFIIETIDIQTSDIEKLQQYVGKTVIELENAGYNIDGFALAENFTLYAVKGMEINECSPT